MGDLITDLLVVFAVIGLAATGYHSYRAYQWVRAWFEQKFTKLF